MKELKIEHLAPYLPYNLRFVADEEEWEMTELDVISPYTVWAEVGWSDETLDYIPTINSKHMPVRGTGFELKDIKPILRPLSDLTKEIEHNGENIATWKEINTLLNDGKYSPYFNNIEVNEWGGLRIDFGDHSTGYSILEANKVIQQLLEWHFDIYGLIEQNLAIEK